MDLKTLRDEFDRVVKKQEVSTTEYRQLIDKVNDEIQQAITDLQSDVDHKSVIEDLSDKLDTDSLQEKLKMLRKNLKADLSNYPEILGKLVETDISKAYKNVEFDSHIVNQIILNLLYHEGLFDVADLFITETQEPDNILLRTQFSEMHRILDALEARILEPAVNWTLANRQKLNQTGSFLEFDLRRLQFLDLVENNRSMEAVNFAKTYLSPLASNNWIEFLNLMGCLLWPGSKLKTSPYSYLWPGQWAVVSGELMFEFCGSMGTFIRNPLAVTVDAGAQALPTFLKFANMAVEVDLGREFQFHSFYVCPVSCELCDDDNPAVLLSCGHLFNHIVISNLSNHYRYMFKCPNCRYLVTSLAHFRRLYF